VGLFPALYAKLKELRRIVAVGTIQGGPVSFDLRITVDPRAARGFAPVVGKLVTPRAKLSDEHSPDQPPDDPGEGPYLRGLFGTRIPMSLVKTRRRRFGRRR
jgi:hypothetical protein